MCAAPDTKRSAMSPPTKTVDRMVRRQGMFTVSNSQVECHGKWPPACLKQLQEMLKCALFRPKRRRAAAAMLHFTQAAAAYDANGSRE